MVARGSIALACLWAVLTLVAPGPAAFAQSAPRQVPKPPGENVAEPKLIPPLPGTRSPATLFRELLGIRPAQRAAALADRTEHQRDYLQGCLREYEGLPPAQREARLQQLELSYHLPPLMKLPPTNRVTWLNGVPPELRPIVDERLRQWDLLPANVQREVLQHETTANYFLRRSPESAGPDLRPAPFFGTGPSNEVTPRRASARLTRFFDLPRDEQQKTLGALPASEREEMERTLQQFANLPADQRKTCIESFDKLQRMSKGQRDQFLKNAARWKAMTPRERETWRALVSILPPVAGLPPAYPAVPGGDPSTGPGTISNNPASPEAGY